MRVICLTILIFIIALLSACSQDAANKNLNTNSYSNSSVALSTKINTNYGISSNDTYSKSNLFRAASTGNAAEIVSLISQGEDVNAKAADMRTPLFDAVMHGQLGAVQTLLDKGADVNARHNEGVTAIWWAATDKTENATEIVKALLAKGADVRIKSNDGDTLLKWAKRYKNKEIIRLIQEAESASAALPPLKDELSKPAPSINTDTSDGRKSLDELSNALEELKEIELESRPMVGLRNDYFNGAAGCAQIMRQLKPRVHRIQDQFNKPIYPTEMALSHAAGCLAVCVNCLANDDDTDCRCARDAIKDAEMELKKELRESKQKNNK